MSYNISLIQKVTVGDVGNYTYNVSSMYYEALGMMLSDLNGKYAYDIIPIIAKGLADMANNPDKYKAMNPANGWGNYDGALNYLGKLLNECLNHPEAQIEVD